jgi:hypothetical protein
MLFIKELRAVARALSPKDPPTLFVKLRVWVHPTGIAATYAVVF